MAKDRNQVPANLKWRVEDIFESVEAWNALYAECEGELDFSEFEGKLNTVESVLSCMEKLNALVLKLNKLAIYAHIRHDEDSRVSEFTALSARFSMLAMKLSGATAFITPELTAMRGSAAKASRVSTGRAVSSGVMKAVAPETFMPSIEKRAARAVNSELRLSSS